jgi:tRNA nucleotidyltransferase/poly(A) polymerase
MLKAVRMAVTYRFVIDEATIAAIRPRAPRIESVAAERVSFELSRIFSANEFRTAAALLRRTELDVPLFGRELPPIERDRVPHEAAMALLVDDPRAFGERWRWSETLIRDVTTLRKLSRHHDLIALYDAGERLARMLPDPDIPMPDFDIRALLGGEEIASIAGIEPGPELGRIKRALLEAQIRGEVKTREEAEKWVAELVGC